MNNISLQNVLVVFKKSRYELYCNSSDKAVKRFMANTSEDLDSLRKGHEEQKETLEHVLMTLEKKGIPHDVLYRADLMQISGKDLVISVGGDGTFLEVAHYVQDIPILGVRSSSASIGFYCATDRTTFEQYISTINQQVTTRVHRLEVLISGKPVREQVLNDVLLANTNPADTTKYRTIADGVMSTSPARSGLLVSTAAGSTAFIYNEGGEIMPLDSPLLQYRTRGYRKETVHYAKELIVEPLLRRGKIYIDGAHLTYKFDMNDKIFFRNGMPLTIVADLEKKRKDVLEETL
jgi:NAD+ kinase